MVKGLEHFKKYFGPYVDQYVLIGGTACTVLMENSGLDFRSTKDLDMVLYVEALNTKFVTAFWEFIKAGGYQNKQHSTKKEMFYRFSSPTNQEFPAMLELFSRVPDGVKLSGKGHLTPIPMSEAVSSLSAILLDNDYYHFIHTGKREIDGLSILNSGHIIPLKARAWIDLMKRKNSGANIDDKDIRKHKNDVIRMYQLLSSDDRIELPRLIKEDMQFFLHSVGTDKSIDLRNLGIKQTNIDIIIKMLHKIYNI